MLEKLRGNVHVRVHALPSHVFSKTYSCRLESANAVMSKLAGVAAVEVREEGVEVKLDVTAYNGSERKMYTLTLVIGQGTLLHGCCIAVRLPV